MQKARQRKRLKLVDKVVDTVSTALQNNGGMTTKAVERWYREMPREEEMLPKDKYTIFDRKEKRYRKGIHTSEVDESQSKSQPAWFLDAAAAVGECRSRKNRYTPSSSMTAGSFTILCSLQPTLFRALPSREEIGAV
ncbi:hypothetical protein LTS03_008466 [Exophiala xenobiotica]|nr:hypothetical protein LTR93_006343 [Exophiala xenobiotica]KAK5367424.1 hypothetical protein LTS03_008466 [Exophiala xenobiotica]